MKYLLIFVLLFCACSTKVAIYNIAPPKSGVPTLHRVTVMPFKGDQGGYLYSSFTKMLPQLQYDGVSAYQVMDRELLRNIIAEQEFQMTLADPDTMMDFGMLAGIEGGFTGEAFYDSNSQRMQEERFRVVDNKTRIYYVNCTIDTYDLRLSLRLVDYRTSSVLYSDSFTRSLRIRRCPDGSSSSGIMRGSVAVTADGVGFVETPAVSFPSTSRDGYYVQMANSILEEVSKDFGEYPVKMTATVASKDDLITDKADKEIFSGAVEAMDMGRADRACQSWRDLAAKYPNAPYLTYNLGLCSEVDGDIDAALEYYTAADRLLLQPDRMVNESLNRIKLKQAENIR